MTKTLEARIEVLEARVETLGRRLTQLMGEDPDQLTGDDAELFEELKVWRRAKAAELGVPMYVVFPDKVLATIASSRPTDQWQLVGIKGISSKRVTDYGDEVLAIITRRRR
jgi:ATP-dependent DNA helicase RecQ